MKILNKQHFTQTASAHSFDIYFNDFMKSYRSTAKPYSDLVNDTTLASVNPLCFNGNFLERT